MPATTSFSLALLIALPSGRVRTFCRELRDRVAGKWSVQAVVADADDHAKMAGHTAIQARLRELA
jgi:hypothetical protein